MCLITFLRGHVHATCFPSKFNGEQMFKTTDYYIEKYEIL